MKNGRKKAWKVEWKIKNMEQSRLERKKIQSGGKEGRKKEQHA